MNSTLLERVNDLYISNAEKYTQLIKHSRKTTNAAYTYPPQFTQLNEANRAIEQMKHLVFSQNELIQVMAALTQANQWHVVGELYFLQDDFGTAAEYYNRSKKCIDEVLQLNLTILESNMHRIREDLALYAKFFMIEELEAQALKLTQSNQVEASILLHMQEIELTQEAIDAVGERQTELREKFLGHIWYAKHNQLKCMAAVAQREGRFALSEKYLMEADEANQKSVELNPQWKEYDSKLRTKHLMSGQNEDLDPVAYLNQIYSGDLDVGSRELLSFYAELYAQLDVNNYLEFGGGPTIYSLISVAEIVDSIHFTDFNPNCLIEIKKWISKDVNSFDWSKFTRHALDCEQSVRQSSNLMNSIRAREDTVREKVKYITLCDAFADDPLMGYSKGPYDIVANNFCLEGITSDKTTWIELNRKLLKLVNANGYYVSVSLLNATHWSVESHRFPSVTLTASDILSCYSDLGLRVIKSRVVPLEGRSGYDSFIMICGQKLNAPSS
ncbi:MAG: hypothetical protein IPO91_03485 [Chloroflexi bacterium]|nr:hypothetical protein [Chloroflexota bacterium]